MKKNLLLLVLSSTLFGAGYQVPNSSINSHALATANIANAHGADSAYYNPANMVYNENKHQIEASVTYATLNPITYSPSDGSSSIESSKHTVPIPAMHYVSNKLFGTDIRMGFSINVPYGLTREWEDSPAIKSAKKFSLELLEFNPSIAIPLTNNLSVAAGLRYVRASGNVVLENPNIFAVDMQGDANAFGYNLAISYKPSKSLTLSTTYRSAIMLKLEGDADLKYVLAPSLTKSDASLEVAIPDNLILAAAYAFNDKTTLEVTYDITYWSKVTETNFEYENPQAEAIFGRTSKKEWHDTYAYRLGLTHVLNEKLTLMGGIAYSTNASDEEYVSFSSPEADSMTYAFGGRYALSQNLDLGFSVLYADYEDRKAENTTVKGTFSSRDVYTFNTGISYSF